MPPSDAYDERSVASFLEKNGYIATGGRCELRVCHRSIDARQRHVMVNVGVRLYVDEPAPVVRYESVDYHDVSKSRQVVVVGAGPAGLFAALRLIELGFRPVVVERGKDVRQRKIDLARISREQAINPESNYGFGEGGAGAYSDGKLFTRSKKRGSVDKILRVFCQHGTSESILVDAHPHIGTDKLPRVIENIRHTILYYGGEVLFQHRMTSIIVRNGEATGVIVSTPDGEKELMGPVIMATGHSARDVYHYLVSSNIPLEAKGIAVGVRLEHPQHLIDCLQYHSKDGQGKWLPAAEYSFTSQIDGRGVYSFCMCPGGFIVPAATGNEQLVVNGMSPSGRGGAWANSGMVVELRPEDVDGNDILRVMRYQESIERDCWQAAMGRQTAPAQRMTDFVSGRFSATLPRTSYAPGVVSLPVHTILPPQVSSRLRKGFSVFGHSARGFLTSEAMVLAPETRSSAPVRVLRDPFTLSSPLIGGLFPCGEGAGYAGGIVSAAIDGERCAEQSARYLGS